MLALRWHRIADNVLATHSADLTVRVWDVENQKSTMMFEDLPNFCTAMRWNPDGKTLGVVCKGGEMVNFDPRSKGEIMRGPSHNGPKACKLAWVDENFLITSGSSKQAEREYAVWDRRDMSKKVAGGFLGTGLGVGHLYFDEQHKLLYSAGRGEQQIGIW